ncbi:GDP-mannose 4,6 dehydratase [Gammaproteobacteria bacterium SCGC AG-212-F23]|nr:GDP-mannose 4,6 dehydratase [Gammaproteobacteria bacterium SCGC AG-212-F23]
MARTALMTGITGQDGSYLAELLVQKKYRVVGLVRNSTASQSRNIAHLHNQIDFIFGNLNDSASIYTAIQKAQPDEIYNLASQSYPSHSWELSLETAEVNGLGAHRLFDVVRQLKPDCKIYQASSSEMYGDTNVFPQNESTPFNPINPYAAAKLYAHNIAKIYRKSYNMFISCGILFNHESPKRPPHFVCQKITYAAACLKLGIENSPLFNEYGEPLVKNNQLTLGNLDIKRDWGFAGDYVEAMWLMLQHKTPEDFVIGTGQMHSLREICEIAFSHVGLNWKNYIKSDPRFIRPTETNTTVADAAKAKQLLNWTPKVTFSELIKTMVDSHLIHLKSQVTHVQSVISE